MNKDFACSRRQFLAASSAAVIGSAAVSAWAKPEPPARNGAPFMKLSLAAYSFNSLLVKNGTPEQIAEAKFSLEKFIDFCAEQNLDGAELTSYYFPKEITNDYLMSIKERTFRLGLDISGTAIGNDFCVAEDAAWNSQLELCRAWIDHAAVMGAPVIRIFAGKVPKGGDEATAIARCQDGINRSLEYAATKGVVLALENHGGITSTPEQMMRILDGIAPSPWFGINLDGGNFQTEDPYADLEKIAPYAVNAQVKVEVTPAGKGKESADLARVVKILQQANYRGYLVLEYEAAEDPFEAIPAYLDRLRSLIG